VVAATLATLLPAAAFGIWLANSPTAVEAAAPPAVREAYVTRDFEAYYSSAPAAQFASQVFSNNVLVAFQAFALGIFSCVGTIYVLVFNGANLGLVAGLFAAVGQQPKFWGLILPHGLLELTSVFVAGGAGLRLGWMTADAEILKKLIIVKQAADLHTSGLDQRIAHRYLIDNDVEEHIALIRRVYGERYGVMDRALAAGMPEGFVWTHPEGGMFLWVSCPARLDTGALLDKALRHKVMFVPGRDFFPGGGGHSFMRLNFSNADNGRIEEGISRLAKLCGEQ